MIDKTHLSWIWHPPVDGHLPDLVLFRKCFELSAPTHLQIHISADQRYQFFVDGERRGLGPERGDTQRWFFESYTLELASGPHVLSVLAWYWLESDIPGAQISEAPGFILAAEPPWSSLLSTGIATWEASSVSGVSFEPHHYTIFTGSCFCMDGSQFDYSGIRHGQNKGDWITAQKQSPAFSRNDLGNPYGICRGKWLEPAMLPHKIDKRFRAARCRWASLALTEKESLILANANDENLVSRIGLWLSGKESLVIPAQSCVDAILELDNYYCAYPELVSQVGHGSRIELGWAESLFTDHTAYSEACGKKSNVKGDRREILGKRFKGDFDCFLPGGRTNEILTTLWWRSGRYLELRIQAGEEVLKLQDITFLETRLPLENLAVFDCSDARLPAFIPVGWRSLQMCAHETSIDCPYYEQLQYIGDARLNFLCHYALANNDRLARKSILQYDESRLPQGLMRCSYPNREIQIIPGFSLYWIHMVWDFARYRRDADFVRQVLPGGRAILDFFHRHINANGVVANLPFWNFIDWVPEWQNGVPPMATDRASCINSLEYAEALQLQAELETSFGEPHFADIYSSRLTKLKTAISNVFWSRNRGLLADDSAKTCFSEHCQTVALKLGLGESGDQSAMLIGLRQDTQLRRCTIYYSWQLFEAILARDEYSLFIDRMKPWFDHGKCGLVTCAETLEPSRSDCHAWGAHPIWHYYSSLLGIRPGSWGFTTVTIRPCLGALDRISGSIPHHNGVISAGFERQANGDYDATILLPEKLNGELIWQDQTIPLHAGENKVSLTGKTR